MKSISILLLLLFVAALNGGCAITHEYGPYRGKVVEKETGEPIEGAVVFLRFYTGSGNIGGMTSHYADAVETLTDAEGGFMIPPHRVNTFRLLHGWVKEAYTIVFKPGYGAFPRHRESEPELDYGALPANEPVTIKLPKLETREERKRNLWNISFTSDVPHKKWRNLFEYRNIESIEVGLHPYKDAFEEGK